MSEFDAIRPYNDDEVRPVLNRLINDKEFLDLLIRLRTPSALRSLCPIVSPLFRSVAKSKIAKQTAHVKNVGDLQKMMRGYLRRVVRDTVSELTISGLEKLDKNKAYLFISNHRDIAMDSAFVNLTLFDNDFSTLRVAIGDNLLTKPFASDLMRVNKAFIVNRSATAPREKLKAAKLLSKYIHQSVVHENENVWIAQREGRAKDGFDKTNAAIISMIGLSRSKQQAFADYIRDANIIPVSISYEYDPCDEDKAQELSAKEDGGEYIKDQHEDILSIAKGISGQKGNVHLCFGDVLVDEFENAEQVTTKLDYDIVRNYQLHPSNCIAYEKLKGRSPNITLVNDVPFLDHDWIKERKAFDERLESIPEHLRSTWLASYANPVRAKLDVLQEPDLSQVDA